MEPADDTKNSGGTSKHARTVHSGGFGLRNHRHRGKVDTVPHFGRYLEVVEMEVWLFETLDKSVAFLFRPPRFVISLPKLDSVTKVKGFILPEVWTNEMPVIGMFAGFQLNMALVATRSHA